MGLTGPAAPDELVERARALAPRFRARAAAAEAARTLPAESVAELLDAGFARILAPPRFGGYGLGVEESFDVVRELGKGDASHAWCAALMIEIPRYVAAYPLAAQEAVWADGPDVALAGSIMPLAQVTPVAGGYRLSGRSPFSSGINHASWVFLGGMMPGERGPEWAVFLLPRADFEIEDTWRVAAMAATGSNTVVTDAAFVPDTHVLALADLREGRMADAALHPEARLYRSPHIAWAPLTFVLPMLGAAQAAYEEYVAWLREQGARDPRRLAEAPAAHAMLGRVAADLDAAELLLRRVAQTAQAPTPPSLELRARAMRDYSRSAQLILEAVDAIVAGQGTAAFRADSALARTWRDLHFAASHASLGAHSNFAHWGRTALGLERPPDQPFF
jgi:3-hydroxy-9,10-secoandrosta-1,3,5(10)-triene-9,17-dione monooxygenase